MLTVELIELGWPGRGDRRGSCALYRNRGGGNRSGEEQERRAGWPGELGMATASSSGAFYRRSEAVEVAWHGEGRWAAINGARGLLGGLRASQSGHRKAVRHRGDATRRAGGVMVRQGDETARRRRWAHGATRAARLGVPGQGRAAQAGAGGCSGRRDPSGRGSRACSAWGRRGVARAGGGVHTVGQHAQRQRKKKGKGKKGERKKKRRKRK